MPLELNVVLNELEFDIQNAQRKIDLIEEQFGLGVDTESKGIDVINVKPEGADVKRI